MANSCGGRVPAGAEMLEGCESGIVEKLTEDDRSAGLGEEGGMIGRTSGGAFSFCEL